MTHETDEDSFRLTRDGGGRGPSLAERLTERFDRLSFASPFHRMRLKGRFPLKLIAIPDDPIPGDPDLGQRLKGGRLFRDGFGQGMTDARLDAPDAPPGWRDWVHGWGWLRDLASAQPLSRTEAGRAEALARRWLAHFHDYHDEAWAPDATGRRILMTIAHAPLVMPGQDHIHRSSVLNGIARWARHLDRAAPRLPAGLVRLEAAAGLIGAGLMLPGGDERLLRGETLLEQTLSELTTADGAAVVSRSPLELARIGDLLLVLEAFYRARARKPAELVVQALDMVRTGLASLAMGDGLPSSWHGGQPDLAQMQRLGVGGPAADGPTRASGFQRLQAGSVRLMVDAGPPPAARISPAAHASTLAFTLTDGARHLIVNCGGGAGPRGPYGFPPELLMGLRSTAGHSTLVLADTSSSRLHDGGQRRLGGVEAVLVEMRASSAGQWFEGRHDGWRRRFGLDHVRRLWLSPDGDDLRGEDRLEPAGARAGVLRRRGSLAFAIRFHLGRTAEATLTQDGRGALVRLPGAKPGQGAAWAFRASFNGATGGVSIEPSLFVDEAGETHEVQQIVLSGTVAADGTADTSWSFRRQGGGAS